MCMFFFWSFLESMFAKREAKKNQRRKKEKKKNGIAKQKITGSKAAVMNGNDVGNGVFETSTKIDMAEIKMSIRIEK